MAGNLDFLEPIVGQILRAPGTDLSTISAKRVRRQLPDLEPSLTPEYLKEHKEAVDNIISRVFEQVSAENPVRQDSSSDHEGSGAARKRNRDEYGDDDDGQDDRENDDEEEEEEKPVRPPPKKAKKSSAKNGQKITDEELAWKLSNEINGRTTRTSGKSSGKGRAAKGRIKKSAATVDSDGESDDVVEKKSKKSKASGGAGTGGPAKGGFKKEFALSEPLAEVLQVTQLARPQVVKQLWVYIKGNELQNPSNKREILCDPKLKAVFGVDKIDMFMMNKVLGRHLHELEEEG